MRKILKASILMFVFLPFVFNFSPTKTYADAYGPWDSVAGYPGCEVRVVTDYLVYTSTATTIDVYAESRGCPLFYYEMNIVNPGRHGAGPIQTGSFAFQTPVKYFNIDDVPTHSGSVPNRVYPSLVLYSDASRSNYVDVIQGNYLEVHR